MKWKPTYYPMRSNLACHNTKPSRSKAKNESKSTKKKDVAKSKLLHIVESRCDLARRYSCKAI